MIILASASKARRKLIKICKKNVIFRKPNINESRLDNEDIYNYLQRITYLKALKFVNKYSVVIAADTVIVFNSRIIGKPRDRSDAFDILNNLSGGRHYCFSGVTILSYKKYQFFIDYAVVGMNGLNNGEINDYLNSGEYIGRAGGYAIQGKACNFMNVIKGDINTVIGLPIKKLCRII